jgi:hypothetical protein
MPFFYFVGIVISKFSVKRKGTVWLLTFHVSPIPHLSLCMFLITRVAIVDVNGTSKTILYTSINMLKTSAAVDIGMQRAWDTLRSCSEYIFYLYQITDSVHLNKTNTFIANFGTFYVNHLTSLHCYIMLFAFKRVLFVTHAYLLHAYCTDPLGGIVCNGTLTSFSMSIASSKTHLMVT